MVTDTSPANPIMNTDQQQAFQDYLNLGGNFIAVHAASDCLHDTTFYGQELGAYFLSHPTISTAVSVMDQVVALEGPDLDVLL